MTHHHWQDPERDAGERFELLYRRHFRVVLGYALARLEPERAKDVAAETFLIAWRRLRDVPDEPVGWLLAVARKVIAGQLRAAARRDALRGRIAELGDSPGPPSDPADVVARRQAALSALSRLGPMDREVLMLTAWDGPKIRNVTLANGEKAIEVTGPTWTYNGFQHKSAVRLAIFADPQFGVGAGGPPAQVTTTTWIDATTYLPIKTQVTAADGTVVTSQAFSWFPATPANLAPLRHPVQAPPGFTHTGELAH